MECHTRFSPVQCAVAVCKIDEMHSDSFVVASVLFAGAQVVLSGGVKKICLSLLAVMRCLYINLL